MNIFLIISSFGWLRLIVTIIFICSISKYSTAQTTLQIDSCYAIAKRNYPLIKQYELIDKATEYTISNANKAFLPQLDITGIGAYIFGGFPNLGPPTSSSENDNTKFIGIGQLKQVIWDGGATKSQKEIIKSQSAVDKANIDVQLYALKDRINQLYFGILLIDEQVKQIDIQIETLRRNADRVKLMNENGLALNTDKDELQAEILKVQQKRIEFEYTRKGFLYMLSLFMSQQLDDSVKMEIPQTIFNSAEKNNRPELSLYAGQRNLADAQYSMNDVRLMPKVGLLGAGVLIAPGINLGLEKKSSLALAGLSVSWELGGLYTHSGNKNLYKINIDKIKTTEETFLFNTNVQSRQSTADIEKYKSLVESDDAIVKLRTSIREGYQLQYNNKSCSLFDVITATEKETEARSNQSLHNIQLLMANYQLKTINGN